METAEREGTRRETHRLHNGANEQLSRNQEGTQAKRALKKNGNEEQTPLRRPRNLFHNAKGRISQRRLTARDKIQESTQENQATFTRLRAN
jgi:hypothetical protein